MSLGMIFTDAWISLQLYLKNDHFFIFENSFTWLVNDHNPTLVHTEWSKMNVWKKNRVVLDFRKKHGRNKPVDNMPSNKSQVCSHAYLYWHYMASANRLQSFQTGIGKLQYQPLHFLLFHIKKLILLSMSFK